MSFKMARPKNTIPLAIVACLIAPLLARGAPAVVAGKLTNQPDAWFQSDEGKQIVDNIVSWQNPNGGWWKQYDASRQRRPDDTGEGVAKPGVPQNDNGSVWSRTSTFE